MSRKVAEAWALSLTLVAALGGTALAQDETMEYQLDGYPEDETFTARWVGDYVVVDDDDYCRILIGATYGSTSRYLPEESVGKSGNVQRKNLIRFAAPGDENTALCAAALADLGSDILPASLAPLLESGSAAAPEVPSGEGMAFNGNGPWISGAFRLEGGTYLAMVAASACDAWDAMLKEPGGADVLPEPITASELLEDIAPGVYYWSVMASDCDWSLRTLPEQE